MGYFLALVSALVFGCADFCGGRATRNASAAAVTFLSQSAGLVVLAFGVLFVNGNGPSFRVIGWGAIAGFAGAGGILLLYRALAIGVMSIVSPVTAVVSAGVPVLYGIVVDRERPSLGAFVGIALALVAIVLVSLNASPEHEDAEHADTAHEVSEHEDSARTDFVPDHPEHLGRADSSTRLKQRTDVAVIVTALGAGLGFGLFYVFLKRAGEPTEVGLWALVGARPVSMLISYVVAKRNRDTLRVGRNVIPVMVAAGCLDQLANVLYALSIGRGLFAVIGVLASLYPVSTVALALGIDRERLRPLQVLGLVSAVGGTIAIALGG